MQYKKCPICGAHLDFGERCDCENEKRPSANGRNSGNMNNFSNIILSHIPEKVKYEERRENYVC